MKQKFSADEFRQAARSGTRPEGIVERLSTEPATEVAGASRTLRFTFSDGTVDRAKDRIDPNGWDLKNFFRNPVALWCHLADQPPIGRAKNVGVVGGARLMGDIEFAPRETYAFADDVYRLAKGGYLQACSVGFIPTQWSFSNDPDRPYGIDFKQQELCEISLCAVPSNPNSLAQARAAGIDTSRIQQILRADGARQARIIQARKIAAGAFRSIAGVSP